MVGRLKEPIDSVVKKGKSHLTKEQIEERREAEGAIKFGTDNIARPTWLDAVAKKMWVVLVEELTALDLMTNADVYALSIACDAYSNYVKAARAVRKDGQKVEHVNAGKEKNTVQNPSIFIAQKYHLIFKSYLAEFGLSPASRARLATVKDDGDDSEDDDLD